MPGPGGQLAVLARGVAVMLPKTDAELGTLYTPEPLVEVSAASGRSTPPDGLVQLLIGGSVLRPDGLLSDDKGLLTWASTNERGESVESVGNTCIQVVAKRGPAPPPPSMARPMGGR